jgi:hypothetical protein
MKPYLSRWLLYLYYFVHIDYLFEDPCKIGSFLMASLEEGRNWASRSLDSLKDLGELKEHKEVKLPNGDVYFGELRRGIFEGEGTYTFVNKTIYKGSFTNGKPQGIYSLKQS